MLVLNDLRGQLKELVLKYEDEEAWSIIMNILKF